MSLFGGIVYKCLMCGLTCLFDCLFVFPCCFVSLCSFVLFVVLLIVFVAFACPYLLLLRVLSCLCDLLVCWPCSMLNRCYVNSDCLVCVVCCVVLNTCSCFL